MNHTNMDCKVILENLNAYIDGELDPTLCDDIEGHIDACSHCKIVVNTLKKTIHLYKKIGDETTLPSTARRRLYTCLDLDDYANKD